MMQLYIGLIYEYDDRLQFVTHVFTNTLFYVAVLDLNCLDEPQIRLQVRLDFNLISVSVGVTTLSEYYSQALSSSQALFGTFPSYCAYVPFFHISYNSFSIIHMSASSLISPFSIVHAKWSLVLLPFGTTLFWLKTPLSPLYNNNGPEIVSCSMVRVGTT